MLASRTLRNAGFGTALLLGVAVAASAQSAHLTLQSQPGAFIGQGGNYDITYTPANTTSGLFSTFFANVRHTGTDGLPDVVDFSFAQHSAQDNYATLAFTTEQLGAPLQPGTYTDAQRPGDAAPGHPGLDVSFRHRASNTLTGSFTITDFSFTPDSSATAGYRIDRFDASFEQHSDGNTPALFGTFSYNAAPVPEASTVASFGLLLALSAGGVIVAARRQARAAS